MPLIVLLPLSSDWVDLMVKQFNSAKIDVLVGRLVLLYRISLRLAENRLRE